MSVRAAVLALAWAASATTSGCSCGVDHVATDAGMGIDSGTDAWARLDWGTAGDDGVCRPRPARCQDDSDCVAWVAAVGPPGATGVTRCINQLCTLGDFCITNNGITMCACGGLDGTSCNTDEVCVIDTPDGGPRCVLDCAGR